MAELLFYKKIKKKSLFLSKTIDIRYYTMYNICKIKVEEKRDKKEKEILKMTIKKENITATYVDNITIDIQLVGGEVVSVRVYDEDVLNELQSDEFFFDNQEKIDWLLKVGNIIER